MEPIKSAKEGKRYKALDGPAKGQEGICVETWETGFGHKFLKFKTSTGVHSMRVSDVERVKRKS